jgi:outer membrane receptor protein involved in Fe transport
MSTKHQVSVLCAALAAGCLALAPVPVIAQDAEPEAEQVQDEAEATEAPKEEAAAEEAPAEEAAAEEAPAEEAGADEAPAEPPAVEEAPPASEAPAEPVSTPPPAAETEAPAAGPGDASKDVEDIYITGSRVRRTDLATPAPVTVLDRQQIDASGMVTIGEILQNLPSQSNAINLQFNNGGTGATRVNLRGLGTARTLVLVNGRRFVPGGTGANASVDLNAIPAEIIERVEVLKDGASAIYGSDAVAGVVNIITKKDFSGVEGQVYTAGSQHGGIIYNLAVTAGESTERAGLFLSFNYFNQSELLAGKREFSRSDLAFDFESYCPDSGMMDATDGACGTAGPESDFVSTLGSSAPPEGLIIDRLGETGNAAWQSTGGGVLFNDPSAGWRAASLTGNSDVGEGDFYNYQPENYLLTPSERYSVYGAGHYSINDYIRTSFEASYTNRQSDQLLAPTPLFIITEGLTVDANNVYNPFGRNFIDVRRRMVEAGNRNFLQDVDTYRFSVGADGRLPDGLGQLSTFGWDLSFIYGRTEGTNVNEGRFVRSRVANAIGPSYIDAAGTARCGTPDNPIAGCVPLNLFGGAGSITQDMLDYISYVGIDRGFSEQQMVNFNVNGELFEWYGGPWGLALGFQHRREEGANIPDPITASGDTTGNKGEPTEGSYVENAFYAELNIPFGVGAPGLQAFDVNLAGRFFDFDTFGSDFVGKASARWQVVKHVALRGTYSTAFRAPSVGELFSGVADSFPNITDPCDTSQGAPSPEQAANCSADGLPSNYEDSRTQLRSVVGGNPNLQAETANTFTAGLVLTPKFNSKWTDGISLTLDYYNIDLDKSVEFVGAATILNNCYGRPERSNCDQIVRAPNGFLTIIRDTLTNIGRSELAGLDISLQYQLRTPAGRFGFNWDGTWQQKYKVTLADGSFKEVVGAYDDVGIFPEFRFTTALVWGLKDMSAGWNLRFIGGLEECLDNVCNISSPDADGNFTRADTLARRNVGSNTTQDIWVGYSLSTPIGFTQLRAGINNFLDQEPPKIYNGFLANSDASMYDYLGRYFYLSARHRF